VTGAGMTNFLLEANEANHCLNLAGALTS